MLNFELSRIPVSTILQSQYYKFTAKFSSFFYRSGVYLLVDTMVALKKFSTVNIQVRVSIKPSLSLENFVTFILQIFDFQIISKFLN